MNLSKIVILVIALLMVACANQKAVRKEIAKMEKGPSEAPRRIITNFSDGLRCMDSMLIEYGIRDVSMLVEDLSDKTSVVKAGTKDMLITAVSAMTRRSRAVKLIPFGNDSGNLIAFLGNAGSESVYNIIPQYDIRGSISQLDKSVVSKQSGASLAGDKWSLGGSKSIAGSILGLDLSVLTTDDLSVIPGVTSSNSVVLFKSGSGADADATIKKTGISFDFSVKKSEATIQALRNLVELASIELIGKLVKIPYWRCLGIPETTADIQQEMGDWFYAMNAHGELIPYIRSLLIARNYYPSVVTDESIALRTALDSFKKSAGLPLSQQIDFTLFSALLNRQQTDTKATVPTLMNTATSTVVSKTPVLNTSTVAVPQAKPITLNINTLDGRRFFKPGEPISLTARSSESAYIYCYLTDADQQIQRFFPNRFQKDNFIQAGAEVALPGKMPFDIVANEKGQTEFVNCFATRKDSYNGLPESLKVYDFESMDNTSINAIRSAYQMSAQGNIGEARFVIGSK